MIIFQFRRISIALLLTLLMSAPLLAAEPPTMRNVPSDIKTQFDLLQQQFSELQEAENYRKSDASRSHGVELTKRAMSLIQSSVNRGLHADHPFITELQNLVAELIPQYASSRTQKAVAGPGGTLSGRITETDGVTPIAGVTVTAWDHSGLGLSTFSIATDALGDWAITGLADDVYFIQATGITGFVRTVYDGASGRTCISGFYCRIWTGQPVALVGAATVAGLNFQMEAAGTVQGTVTDSSLTPVMGIGVRIADERGSSFSIATTAADGSWSIDTMPTGEYQILTDATAIYRAQIYPALDCVKPCTDYSGGSVTITAGMITSNIDFALNLGGGIAGTVSLGTTAGPVDGITVTIYDTLENVIGSVQTDLAGDYTIGGLVDGDYYLSYAPPGFVAHAYNVGGNTDCYISGNTSCAVLLGSPVTVAGTATVTGIDFILDAGMSISGRITSAAGGTDIEGATVFINNPVLGVNANAPTDISGMYNITGLPDGTYWMTVDATSQGYMMTALGGSVCPVFSCNRFGTAITVSGAAVVGQDVALEQGGGLSGSIFDGRSGAELPGFARFEVFRPDGTLIRQSFKSDFTMDAPIQALGLPPGPVKLIYATSGFVGWLDTAWGGTPCPRGGCDFATIPTVFVTSGITLSGLDGTLNLGTPISGSILDETTGLSPSKDVGGFGTSLLGFAQANGAYAAFAVIDRFGNYKSRTGLPSGTYYVGTFLERNQISLAGGYIDEVYQDVQCPYGCNFLTGTPVPLLSPGPEITGINMLVSVGGTISGNVNTGGVPISGLEVRAYAASGILSDIASTNILGNYELDGLPDGSYFVLTENQQSYLDELYNNVPCEPFCNPVSSGGTAVVIAAAANQTGIDFDLALGASIAGSVAGAGGPASLSGIDIEVYDALGNLVRTVQTDIGGNYLVDNLADGDYFLRTRNTTGRVDRLNDGSDCVGDACRVRFGTPISLSAGGSATGIDFLLDLQGDIAGTIVDAADGITPIAGVAVNVYDVRGFYVGMSLSGALGDYTVGGLGTGDYFAVTRETSGYIDEAYPDIICPSACDSLNGGPISVTAGVTSTADMQLSTGAAISGSVLGNGAPLGGAIVQVYDAAGVPTQQTATNASGNFELLNIPNGNLFVRTSNQGFTDELWNGTVCEGYCDITNGTPIVIAGALDVGSINFNLSSGGSIVGTVNGPAGLTAGVTIQAFDTFGFPVGSGLSDAAGAFVISGMEAGDYRLRTLNTVGLIDEVYNNIGCSPTPCVLTAGSLVTVVNGVGSTANFTLLAGSGISGTAADQFGNPLPTGTATVFDTNEIAVASTPISAGFWSFSGLAIGSYYLVIENDLGLVDQLYDGLDCPGGSCDMSAGTLITVAARRAMGVTNFDVVLMPGQSISGRVTTSGLAPIANVTVYVFDSLGTEVGLGLTDGLGDYLTEGSFPPGTYYVSTSNGEQRGALDGFINELYSAGDCPLVCDVTAGTALQIPGTTTGIDFSLAEGGAIAGRVRGVNGDGLQQVKVEVYEQQGPNLVLAGTVSTNSLGDYAIDGLPGGTYFAVTRDTVGLEDELFGGDVCDPSCDLSLGAPITVNPMIATPGIDFQLGGVGFVFADGFE